MMMMINLFRQVSLSWLQSQYFAHCTFFLSYLAMFLEIWFSSHVKIVLISLSMKEHILLFNSSLWCSYCFFIVLEIQLLITNQILATVGKTVSNRKTIKSELSDHKWREKKVIAIKLWNKIRIIKTVNNPVPLTSSAQVEQLIRKEQAFIFMMHFSKQMGV